MPPYLHFSLNYNFYFCLSYIFLQVVARNPFLLLKFFIWETDILSILILHYYILYSWIYFTIQNLRLLEFLAEAFHFYAHQ
jgi:hypothetical protein